MVLGTEIFLKPSQNKPLHVYPRHQANGVGYCAGTGEEMEEETQPCPQTLPHPPQACPSHYCAPTVAAQYMALLNC